MAHHEKVVRFSISGAVDPARFVEWVMPEADARGIDGWVRPRGADRIDLLLAGPEFAVDALAYLCGQIVRGAGGIEMTETKITGNEPIWGGFHHT